MPTRTRSTPARTQRASPRRRPTVPGAITLLMRDHRTVEALFREFDRATHSRRKHEIALTVCKEITIHAVLEEELFYPALAQVARDRSGVGEALVEHSVVKGLVQRIEGMKPEDAWYDETVTVLKELIAHHVEEEETELFPAARRGKIDLNDLGLWMKQRKAQLRAEHGLPEAEDLKLDVRETARLRKLEALGPASRLVTRLAALASSITH